MGERDCGKWYCQPAAGFERLVLGKDVKLDWSHCSSTDKKCLDAQRVAVPRWIKNRRAEGWTEWLGAEGHGDGNAKHYWIWDVDSRDKIFEYSIFAPGEVPDKWGDLHRGRGWQLPMLAVFSAEPTAKDLNPLKRNKIPYIVLEGEDPKDPCDDCPCECEPCDDCEGLELAYAELQGKYEVLTKDYNQALAANAVLQSDLKAVEEDLDECEEDLDDCGEPCPDCIRCEDYTGWKAWLCESL
jgi:hypothetical protein